MKRASGAMVLHPLALSSLVLLVANDHVFKRVCPGFVTGKLSDFAGVLLMPLFLHAIYELASERLCGERRNAEHSNRALAVAAVLTALGFGLPEIWPPAELAYRYGLGALHWPFRAALAIWLDMALPAIAPVRATADPTDLLALPMVLVAYRLARYGQTSSCSLPTSSTT